MENWRIELQDWAMGVADSFIAKGGIEGVMIGGSIARGQEWEHSDLELGILVKEKDPELAYFNVIQGRGVEVIQVVRPSLENQFEHIKKGDLSPITEWPIQMWQAKVISDPTGILTKFKAYFDEGLFTDVVISKKLDIQKQKIQTNLKDVNHFLDSCRPAAALVRLRYAMNEAILALHWRYGELPRSQNRTDSRLARLCECHNEMPFYALYRDIFTLDDSETVIQNAWPNVKEEILDITHFWIAGAHDFFKYAVDSNFEWGQNAGILTVYRLYIPNIGAEEDRLIGKIDKEDWVEKNVDIMRFLGLTQATNQSVRSLVERFSEACDQIF